MGVRLYVCCVCVCLVPVCCARAWVGGGGGGTQCLDLETRCVINWFVSSARCWRWGSVSSQRFSSGPHGRWPDGGGRMARKKIGAMPAERSRPRSRRLLLRHVLRSEQTRIFRIAWSPDWVRIVSGPQDGQARSAIPKGNRSKRVLGSHDSCASVAWSPDGRLIASGDDHGAIRIWHIAAGSYDERQATAIVSSASPGRLTGSFSPLRAPTVRFDSGPGPMILSASFPSGGTANGSTGSHGRPMVPVWSRAEDNTVRIWDARTVCVLKARSRHTLIGSVT